MHKLFPFSDVDSWLEWAALVVVIINCVVIALNNPLVPKETTYFRVVNGLDMACTALMTLECIVRLIAMGLIMEKGTFLRDPWSAFDALVITARYVMCFLSGVQLLTL